MRQKIFLLLIIVSVISIAVNAHVLGIDYGSEYMKFAGPHGDRGIDMILNELSQRKTDNFIGFRFGERYIGNAAKNLAARFPLQTASFVNRLLSSPGSDDRLQFESLYLEYLYKENDTGVTIPIADANGPFYAEELNSMLLSYAAKVSVKDGVPDPKTVVVTIPAGSSLFYRESLNYAAKLAGLKVLGLIDSTTATAYYYGMRHRGFGNRTVTLAVVDIGASRTEVGVFQFSPSPPNSRKKSALGTITKLAVGTDFSFGGRALDLCVARIIQDEAKKKLGISNIVGSRSEKELKSHFSLLRAAKKIRETLSVNSETPYTVEGITADRDFSSVFSKRVFEEECGPLFQKVPELVQKVVGRSGVALADLGAVEMMGGVSRTPKLLSVLQALLQRDLSRTLNMDEAAAIGAAYYAANLSPFYHAKSFALRENYTSNLYFTVVSETQKASDRRQLLSSENIFGDVVSITVNRTQDFSLLLFDEDMNADIARISVRNVSDALRSVPSYDPTVPHANNTHIIRVQLRLSEAGLLEVDEAEASIRYSVNVSSKEFRNETDAQGNSHTIEEVVPKTRIRIKNIPLEFSLDWLSPPRISKESFLQSQSKLRFIEAQEEEKHLRSQSKNNLESYIFWAKAEGVLENSSVTSLMGESGVQQFSTLLESTQLWLEEDRGSEDTCSRSEYDDKLAALKNLLAKVTTGEAHPNTDDTAPQQEGATDGDFSMKSKLPRIAFFLYGIIHHDYRSLLLSFVLFVTRKREDRRQFLRRALLPAAFIRAQSTKLFTDSHEWVSQEGNKVTLGITNYAQENLGDIVYVSLPEVGDVVKERDVVAEVESVKATSNVYTPVQGTVLAVNDKLKDEPGTINKSPEDLGWLVQLSYDGKLSSEGSLMDKKGYDKYLENHFLSQHLFYLILSVT
eukprot:gene6162-4441_t